MINLAWLQRELGIVQAHEKTLYFGNQGRPGLGVLLCQIFLQFVQPCRIFPAALHDKKKLLHEEPGEQVGIHPHDLGLKLSVTTAYETILHSAGI